MSDASATIRNELLLDFQNEEFRHAYGEEMLNSHIAAQIRWNREKQKMTQEQLGDAAGMQQNRVSRLERADYGAWTISSLKRLARALDLGLLVKFVSFEELADEAAAFSRATATKAQGAPPKTARYRFARTSERPGRLQKLAPGHWAVGQLRTAGGPWIAPEWHAGDEGGDEPLPNVVGGG